MYLKSYIILLILVALNLIRFLSLSLNALFLSSFSQRKLKFIHITPLKHHHGNGISPPKQLLSSAVATFVNQQQMSALFPLHHTMRHNYIIKTCLTTYTYLTTIVHNKRSAISTFETVVAVITTESLTDPFHAMAEVKPTKVRILSLLGSDLYS